MRRDHLDVVGELGLMFCDAAFVLGDRRGLADDGLLLRADLIGVGLDAVDS